MIRHNIRVLIAILSAGSLVACGGGEKSRENPAATVRGIEVETVHLAPVQEYFEAVGTVRSATVSVLGAQVSGTILEVRVKPGDRVKRGQLLAVLDDRDSRARLNATQAGVEEASQAGVEVDQAFQAAAAGRQFAEATYRRYEVLLKKNSVSRQEFDGAEARYKAALANERALEAKKKQTQARDEQARAELVSAETLHSYSRITSPIDGIVTAKPVDRGTLVMPGTPLVTVEDPSRYRLEASLPEELLPKVSSGMAVAVRTDHGRIEGRVAEIVPAADPASRTVLVKVDLSRDCGCRSGEYGTANFPVGEVKRLTVPRQAVVERGELEGVFVVVSEGTVEHRLVKTGKVFGERVEILAGLSDGDRVATSGLDRLRDGVRVEVR